MKSTEQQEREKEVYFRSVNIGTRDFINAIPQIHFLWQLYYSATVEVNNPHPENPNAKTFKEWLIHLTLEDYEEQVERYIYETGIMEML